MNLGMIPHTIVKMGGLNNISYGKTHDRISYGNYQWFYQTYKALSDSNSDLAVALVFEEKHYDKDCSFAVNLVKPVKIGFTLTSNLKTVL